MTPSAKAVIAAAILEALRSADDGAAIYARGGEVVIDGCFNMHSAATAILAALDAAGYVVVPREPTEAMTIDGLVGLVEHITQRFPIPPAKDGEILSVQQAAERYMAIGSRMRDGREVNACYRAMIAAQEKQG